MKIGEFQGEKSVKDEGKDLQEKIMNIFMSSNFKIFLDNLSCLENSLCGNFWCKWALVLPEDFFHLTWKAAFFNFAIE